MFGPGSAGGGAQTGMGDGVLVDSSGAVYLGGSHKGWTSSVPFDGEASTTYEYSLLSKRSATATKVWTHTYQQNGQPSQGQHIRKTPDEQFIYQTGILWGEHL
jgi:hypothetical protein